MKKHIISLGLCALCLLAVSMAAQQKTYASSTPGSSGDPIVTKSYVDGRFAELAKMINDSKAQPGGTSSGVTANVSKDELINEVMAQIQYFYGDSFTGSEAFKPVLLKAGEVLVGYEGTEISLRSGKAVSYVMVENGIPDLTTGEELQNNKNLSANHLLIVPKYDARGVKAVTDAWFIVKGGYDKF